MTGSRPRTSGYPRPPNGLFGILSLRRRRVILYWLAEQPGDIAAFDRLVEAVAVREDETERQQRDWAPQRQRVATALHHDDLPRLAAAGIVDYDQWRGMVRYNRTSRLDDWIARTAADADEHEREDFHRRDEHRLPIHDDR